MPISRKNRESPTKKSSWKLLQISTAKTQRAPRKRLSQNSSQQFCGSVLGGLGVLAVSFRRAIKMFLGLRTVAYYVSDIEKARDWYSSILGFAPYFDQPFYVGFNVAGYELGLQPSEAQPSNKAEGVVAYWGVEDAAAALKHLIQHGATPNEDVQDVGGDIKVASVKDPFGNIFGVIENPNFKL